MKFHNILEDVLTSKTKISVLKLLVNYPGKKYSGREVARLSKNSVSRTADILRLFLQYGIVNRVKIGNTSEWTLNERSLLAKHLSRLLDIEDKIYSDLISKIRDAFLGTDAISTVILFGSVARGEENANSDIDLLIITMTEKDKEAAADIVHRLNISLLPRFGNVISPLIYSQGEWEHQKKSPLARQIEREGKPIAETSKKIHGSHKENR